MGSAEHDAASMSAAAAQIEVAMRESQAPVGELAAALERMGGQIAHLRTELSATSDEYLMADCRTLQDELYSCMQALQFYDRMVQHLSHLRDGMAAAAGGEGGWRERVRSRLLSDAQRQAFDLLLPETAGKPGAAAPARAAVEGTVELF